jgi:hypothetical protein
VIYLFIVYDDRPKKGNEGEGAEIEEDGLACSCDATTMLYSALTTCSMIEGSA